VWEFVPWPWQLEFTFLYALRAVKQPKFQRSWCFLDAILWWKFLWCVLTPCWFGGSTPTIVWNSIFYKFLHVISSARQFCVLCGHNWRNGWLSISFSLDSYLMSHVNIKEHFWVLFWKTLVKCIYISVHLCEIRMLQVFVCFQFELAISY
jgi:hypothetical protein